MLQVEKKSVRLMIHTGAGLNLIKETIPEHSMDIFFASKDTIILSLGIIILPYHYINIGNQEKKMSYISQPSVGPGIFLGNALVTNDQGKAYVKIANTQTESVEIRMSDVRK